MQARWANFAKTGDPNYPGVPVPWTPVKVDESESGGDNGMGAVEVPSLFLHGTATSMLPPSDKVDQCSLLVPAYDGGEMFKGLSVADEASAGENGGLTDLSETPENEPTLPPETQIDSNNTTGESVSTTEVSGSSDVPKDGGDDPKEDSSRHDDSSAVSTQHGFAITSMFVLVSLTF